MKANQAELPVRAMCKTLRVSHSGFYDWRDRPACAQAQANVVLLGHIRQAHVASDATYGVPRIQAELAEHGVVAGHNRIAALMRTNGLRGVSRRRSWCVTTKRDKSQRAAADLVQRQFTATRINQLWVADMTYIPTWAGFVYLAVVLDVYSRKVVGWAFGQQQTADLVIAALNMALITRKPQDVIHHSDQGSQYTSLDFGKRCKEMGVRPSMGTVGDAYDNAMAESFFASLECELIDRRSWKTFAEARMAIFTWIEAWYNPRRRHSGIGQKSPINFEKELQNQNSTEGKRNAISKATAQKDGLTNGCFAPVDKPPSGLGNGLSPCPQASPLDNPAPKPINAVLTSKGKLKI
jgi:putative transposase